jgi:hypothetical protein
MRVVMVMGVVLAAGCDNFFVNSDVPDAEPPPHEFQGVADLRYFPDGPDAGMDQAPDLSSVTPIVGFIDADGAYHERSGTATTDGHFDFMNVPSAVAQLNVGDGEVYVTDALSISLRYDVAGRAGLSSASKGTTLDLALDGLSPWQASDSLMLAVPSAGIYQLGLEYNSPTTIAAAATTVPTFTAVEDYEPLFTDTDAAWLYQVRPDSLGNLTVIRGGAVSAVALSDAGSATASVTLADVPQGTMVLDWDVPAFAALAPQVIAGAQPGGGSYSIGRAPGGVMPSPYYFGGPLLSIGSAGSARLQQTVTYGDPFPASWPRFVDADFFFAVPFTVNGQSVDVFADASTVTTKPGTISPVIGPPANIQVDGKSGPASIGENPIVTWDAPALGTPDGYVVDVELLDASYGFGYTVFEALAPANVREVAVSISQPGAYVIVVGAVTAPGSDLATRPIDRSLDWSRTDGVGALLTR